MSTSRSEITAEAAAQPAIATPAKPSSPAKTTTRTKAPAAAPAKKSADAVKAAKAPAQTPKAAKKVATSTPAVAAEKDTKAKKPKLVRDSFTIPKDEYAAIEEIKQRAAKLGHPAKKSELLRAGIKLLAGLDNAALAQAFQAVPSIKTGRPKAERTPRK